VTIPKGKIAASKDDDDDDDDRFENEILGELDLLELGEASSSSSSHHGGSCFNVQHHVSNEGHPVYHPEGREQYYRKRVVRFWDEDEESEASLDAGGLLFADAGLVAADGSLSVVGAFSMVPEEETDKNHTEEQQFDGSISMSGSISMLDVFDEEGSFANKSLSILDEEEEEEGEEDDQNPIDKDAKEEEKQIRGTLLLAIFGVGFIGLVSFGAQKLMGALSRDNNAAEIVGDVVDTTAHATHTVEVGGHIADGVASSASQTTATQQAALNASASSSSLTGSSNNVAAAGVANNPSSATAAQYVPFSIWCLEKKLRFRPRSLTLTLTHSHIFCIPFGLVGRKCCKTWQRVPERMFHLQLPRGLLLLQEQLQEPGRWERRYL
jgi:hypothetical protein